MVVELDEAEAMMQANLRSIRAGASGAGGARLVRRGGHGVAHVTF